MLLFYRKSSDRLQKRFLTDAKAIDAGEYTTYN